MGRFRKSSATQTHRWFGHHRFEHWYRDNSVYFITSRVSDRSAAFASEQAKLVFWDRLNHYTDRYAMETWAATLMDNHYHWLGYVATGEIVGPFMQHLHGSVAKLVNDLLPARIKPFWRTPGNKDYFDGCIRDELQLRRAHKYTRLQAVRARLVRDSREYQHTIAKVDVEDAVRRADELKAYLPEVPYARYE